MTEKERRRLIRRSVSAAYDRKAKAPRKVINARRRYLETKRTSPSEGVHRDTPERAGRTQLPRTSVGPTTGIVVY